MTASMFGQGTRCLNGNEYKILVSFCLFSRKENSIFRLRKWLITRLSSIIDNYQVKRQEDLIMDVAR